MSKVNIPSSYYHRHRSIRDPSQPNLIVSFDVPNYQEARPIATILGPNEEVIKEIYDEKSFPKAKGKLGY